MDNKQKKIAFLGVLLLGCVATSWLQQGKEAKQAAPAPVLTQQAGSIAKEKKAKTMQVYVSGAVREPGIYTLPAGARAKDALEAAGGLRQDAKAERVNLAKKLRDGSHVYVACCLHKEALRCGLPPSCFIRGNEGSPWTACGSLRHGCRPCPVMCWRGSAAERIPWR